MIYHLNLRSRTNGQEKNYSKRKAPSTLKDQWAQVPNIGLLIDMDLYMQTIDICVAPIDHKKVQTFQGCYLLVRNKQT